MFGLFEKYEQIGVFFWSEWTTTKDTKELTGRTVFGLECFETKSGKRKVKEHFIGHRGVMSIEGKAFCDVMERWKQGEITTEQLHECAKIMDFNFDKSLSRLTMAYAKRWKPKDEE